jgi:hypothetical protein
MCTPGIVKRKARVIQSKVRGMKFLERPGDDAVNPFAVGLCEIGIKPIVDLLTGEPVSPLGRSEPLEESIASKSFQILLQFLGVAEVQDDIQKFDIEGSTDDRGRL